MYHSHSNPCSIQSNIFPVQGALLRKLQRSDIHRATNEKSPSRTSNQRRILVIDDEASLVKLAVRFFELTGLTAYGFTNPREAINWYQIHSNEVALTFLDMKMPQMSGQECFYEMKNINDNAQIVLMSGLVEQQLVADLLRNGAVRFLQKPFDYPALIDWTLRHLMGTSPNANQHKNVKQAA